jgi:hypothetical protein
VRNCRDRLAFGAGSPVVHLESRKVIGSGKLA